MQKGSRGKLIKVDIRSFKDNQKELHRNPDSPRAFKILVKLLVTQAWYFREPENFEKDIDAFIAKHRANFRTPNAQKDLMEKVENWARPPMRAQAKKGIRELLTSYPTLAEFTSKLYALAEKDKTKIVGKKGRDNYLRDVGYWDRIPIDRHEMRFIVRTGIFHACSDKQSDPLEKNSFHDALTRFCSEYLQGTMVKGIDLGNAPGIIDVFIWSFCAKGSKLKPRYDICGNIPKCNCCRLQDVCLHSLCHSEKIAEA